MGAARDVALMAVSFETLREAIDLLDTPITLLDLEGRIQYLNPANERLLGRTVGELRGQSIGVLLPEALRERTAEWLASLLERGEFRGAFPNERADGSVVQVEVIAKVILPARPKPGWIVAEVRDLGTEIARLERLNTSLLGLFVEPSDDPLVEVVRVARELLGARYAALGVVEDGALVRFIPDGMSEGQIATVAHWPEGRGLLGAMVAERRTIRTPDIRSDPRSSGFPAGHPPMRSFLGTPVQTADKVYGHLYFTDKLDSADFTFIDERVAEVFASRVAISIRDAQIRAELVAGTGALAESQRVGGIGSGELDIAADRMRWSTEALRIFGVAAERVVTFSDFLALVHPDDRSALQAGVNATVESGRPFRVRHRIVRADGTVHVLDSRAELVRAADGTPLRLIGTVQNITELAAAVDRLRDSQRNLTEAQEVAHIGSWERDLVTGALSWSDESCRIFGIEPGTFAGTLDAFLAFVHPDDRAKAAPSAAALEQGSPTPVEYRIIRADGSLRFIHEVAEAIRDAAGRPIRFVGSTQDITEQVHTEAEQVRLSRLLDDVTSEIYVFDAATLRFIQANAGARRNIGYSMDELREMTPLDLKPEFTRASFKRLIAPLSAGAREQVGFETIHRRKDTSTYPVEVRLHLRSGENPAAYVAIIQDITERLAAEKERAQLVSALEQTADSVVITDPTGAIVYVNAAFERVTGYGRGEVIGENPRILKSGEHGAEFYRSMWATLVAGRPWTGSVVNRRKDGGRYALETTISPVRGAGGELTNFVEVARDVTRERELESALARDAREREAIEVALEGIEPGAGPEEIAAAACAAISRLSNIDSAWVVALEPDRGRALGAAGRLAEVLAADRPLPAATAQYLLDRAASGPWSESWNARPGDGAYGDEISAAGLQTAVYTPLRSARGVVGIMAIGCHDPLNADLIVEHLPALATFGSIIGALVGPRLEARHRDAEAGAGIQAILDERAFVPFFQPIIDLQDGAVVGYEAVSRFADGSSPAAVFATAAAVGLGLELEMATLRAALDAASVLPPDAYLSVNLSPELIGSTGLRPLLTHLGRPVVVEITEHVVVDDYVALRRGIKSLGRTVRLAVDDAGAGYSSLRHILELAPDLVKLDISLVRGIDADPARQALIAGMGYFAVKRNVQLIAEGIETEAELAALRLLGVAFGQGFLTGRPRDGQEPGPWPTRIPWTVSG